MSKPPYRVPSMDEIRALPWNGFTAVSTFSGCGGSSLGYRMAGFRMAWASEFIPAAADTYRANASPTTILDTRDIRKVQPEDILEAVKLNVGEIDLFDGSPPCFPAGTPVLTARGLVPIEQVKVGDEVLTRRGRWRPVTATMSRTAAVGRAAWGAATFDHPFWARRQRYTWHVPSHTYRYDLDAPAWIPAGELGQNDRSVIRPGGLFAAIPAEVPSLPVPDPGVELGLPLWWAVGRWLGDGWTRIDNGDPGPARSRPLLSRVPRDCQRCGASARRHPTKPGNWTAYCSETCRCAYKRETRRQRRADVIICCGFHEADGLASKLADTGLHWVRSDQNTTTRFTASSRRFAEWLTGQFGSGAEAKTIPAWLLGAPAEVRGAVLDGYLSADGHTRQNGSIATTVSPVLAVGVRLLATTLGYTTALSRRPRARRAVIGDRAINQRDAYTIALTADDGRYTRLEDGWRWVKIRRPLLPAGEETVYDLTVAEDHSFIAWGMVVHNCASFSTAGKREKGWNQVKNYSDTKQRTDDLFYEYARLVEAVQPRVFVAENVSGLVKGTAKGYFKLILARLRECGYRVEARLLDASWLGVPQARQRLIFIGVRNDLGVGPVFPKPLPYRYTVRDALPWITAQGDNGGFGKGAMRPADHPSPTIGADLSSGNGNFPPSRVIARVIHDTSGQFGSGDVTDRPSPTILVGLNSMNSRHYQVHSRVIHDNHRPNEPARDVPDSPSATIRASAPDHLIMASAGVMTDPETGNDLSIKPPRQLGREGPARTQPPSEFTQCRKLNLAELRRLGGFPDDFALTGTYEQRWERIGRAVPPVMMSYIAAAVRDSVLQPLRDSGVI